MGSEKFGDLLKDKTTQRAAHMGALLIQQKHPSIYRTKSKSLISMWSSISSTSLPSQLPISIINVPFIQAELN